MEQHRSRASESPPIFVISGGAGALGKHVARIALSQFPHNDVEVIVIPQVCQLQQLTDAVNQAAARGGTIIHTMVEPELRQTLGQMAEARHIPAFDTIGLPLMQLAALLERPPLGQPGLYHGEEEAYLERIKAIEYTVDHDDGRNTHELDEADVVLTGVSRVGKTPLSIYLSVLGWKVANVPLVLGLPPPDQLFQIDRRRVIGLRIDVEELANHRRWRQRAMLGTAGNSYTDVSRLDDELDMTRGVFRRGGFAVVNVTNKPIEESADEIIALITRWFERKITLGVRQHWDSKGPEVRDGPDA
jgi:regulator of PEP synthase PpsR (kinase-PPPase family)